VDMAFSTQKKTRPTAGQFASCLAVQLILSNDPVLSRTSRSKVPNTFPFRAGDNFVQHYTPFGVPASGVLLSPKTDLSTTAASC
jgi:hypothetical protein